MRDHSTPDLQNLTDALQQPDDKSLQHWFAHAPAFNANTWADVSQLCHVHQWPEFALAASERALELVPEVPALMTNHGFILRHCGRLREAAHWLDQSLARAPSQGEAQLVRAELPGANPERMLKALGNLLAQSAVSDADRISLCYAAARHAEVLQRWDGVMHWLDQGAVRKRRSFEYRIERDEILLTNLAQVALPAVPSAHNTPDQARPLFIVGLPRTGTSLLESHLASHPDITGAGELPHFNRALMQQYQLQFGKPPATPAEFVSNAFAVDLESVGQRYLQATQRWSGQRWFIDKLPINSLNLPLIQAALPQAKIIHLHRDPRAMGFALYRQLFGRVYPFSYQQDEMGRYVRAYGRLMARWQPQMPQVQWLDYETAVADWPATLARLFSWLELEPVATTAQGFSATASASQIRADVHLQRVEHWRHFKSAFQTYLAHLETEPA